VATLQPPPIFKLCGLRPTGDLAGFTAYTKPNRTPVWFFKAPPKTPPTQHQRHQRNAFRLAAIAWAAIGPDARARWSQVEHRARLGITGYNLWVYYQLTRDLLPIRTLEHQTRISLLA